MVHRHDLMQSRGADGTEAYVNSLAQSPDCDSGVLELPPIGSCRAHTSCLRTAGNGSGRVARLLVVPSDRLRGAVRDARIRPKSGSGVP